MAFSVGPLSSLPLSSLPSGSAPAGASAAPGWDAQPSFIPAAPRIARAIAAIVFAAGIESTFVPPAEAAPTLGWEAQPQPVVKRAAIGPVQESLSARSTAFAFGWQQQPAPLATPRRVTGLAEGWPLDVVAALVTPIWGFEAQPPEIALRGGRTVAITEGWPLDVAAPAVVAHAWWSEDQPGLARGIARVGFTFESTPLDILFVAPDVVVPPVTPPATGGMMTSGGGRFVRVDDGTIKRLPALDTTAYARTDRPILGQRVLVASAMSQCDQPVLGAYAAFTAHDAIAWAKSDQPVLRKDDLIEIARLTKMARTPKAISPDFKAPADVRGIWALIDRMRGKKQ